MIEGLKNTFQNLLKNKRLLIIVLVLIFFIGVAVYVYYSYIVPSVKNVKQTPYQDGGINANDDNKYVDLYFFYTEWCPHCKKAKPEWSKLESSLENKQINGYTVLFKPVDCDKEPELAEKFNVEGYPTIKLVKDGQVIEYDAKPDFENLTQFLQSVL